MALFTDTFYEVNGAAHTLRKVAETCEILGIPLDVYSYGEEQKVEVRGCVRILTFDHRISNNYYERLRFELVPDLRIGDAFRRAMKAASYTVIHLATPGSIGIAGRWLGMRNKLPMLGTYHTHFADYMSLRSFAPLKELMRKACWKFMRWFYLPCDWVLCPTQGVVEDLRNHAFTNKLAIFTRGIDVDLYCSEKRTRTDSRIVSSYVGRCAPEKNVQWLKPIVDGIDTDLWVIGDGPERANLQRQLTDARFTGYLFGDELARAYADSDVLLFPSTTDTFGNVVLEAMASGVVPIVAEGPGPSDYLSHGHNGLIGKGIEGMRVALTGLLKDRERLSKMRVEARKFAQKQSWRGAVEGLIGYYRSVAVR